MRHYRALPRVFISCNFTARAKRSDDLSCTPIHLVDHLPFHFSPPSDFRDFRLKKTKRKNFKIRTCLNRCLERLILGILLSGELRIGSKIKCDLYTSPLPSLYIRTRIEVNFVVAFYSSSLIFAPQFTIYPFDDDFFHL